MAAEQLQEFLADTVVLDPFQSGFHSSHGTETAGHIHRWVLHRQLDEGGSELLFLFAVGAAFDMVDYSLLTHCLADTGICGVAYSSFLHSSMDRDEGSTERGETC